MVIPCSTCRNKEKECIQLKYLTQFIVCCNLRVLLGQSVLPQFQSLQKKIVLSQSGSGGTNGRYEYGQRSIVSLIFFIYPFPHLFYQLILFFLYQNKSLTTKSPYNLLKSCTTNGFNRRAFAMAVLQAPFSLTFLWRGSKALDLLRLICAPSRVCRGTCQALEVNRVSGIN